MNSSQVSGTACVSTATVAVPNPTRATTINNIGPDLTELNKKVNCFCHNFNRGLLRITAIRCKKCSGRETGGIPYFVDFGASNLEFQQFLKIKDVSENFTILMKGNLFRLHCWILFSGYMTLEYINISSFLAQVSLLSEAYL